MLHLQCYPANAGQFPIRQEDHFLLGCFTQCYIFTALLLMEFHMLAAMTYDGYVAICDSPLQCEDVAVGLHQPSCTALCLWLLRRAAPGHPDLLPDLLQVQCHQPLVLHRRTPSLNSLAQILMSRNTPCSSWWASICQPPSASSWCPTPATLPPFLGSHLQRVVQGLLHLWLPSDSCNLVLLDSLLHVCEATNR